ncbi:hypothetical protein FHW69_003689 [Luteibacter sp. Sphag1AF]|uniref:lipoprotein N-acyltransferase Lnb domain-containing protein n=1 Tax=Luteibacter sp. Sphag1AF TaxID=2587031 RepID=UPI001619256D|nr:DUF4105 domain-containing protein [Luteibacter sp. Sphag1AF]MBB3229040.1 hypothetical protein [Luteibacter sp. Sphag1AF]
MRHFLIALLLLCLVPAARAGIVDAPAANLEVSLLTYGPGAIYWERFGHDAIEVKDTVSGEAVAFNYGVFDFDESGFILNFARGRMSYRMDAEPTASDVSFYSGEGRKVTHQRLNLSNEQKEKLRRFLIWNIQPENARYNYDYYADNCTTRVRDALNDALDGVLDTQLRARSGGMTYREQTARLMSNAPALMLAMDLGLGPYADQPMDAWKESFLPMVLENEIRTITLPNGQPLVSDEATLAPNRLEAPPERAPNLIWPLLAAGLVIAALLLIPAFTRARAARVIFVIAGTLFTVFTGLAGLIMILLWSATLHHSAWANANLLLYQPLALLLLPAIWRMRRGDGHVGSFARRVLIVCVGAAIVGLLAHLIPGFLQRNMPWIAFALPGWIALYIAMRRQPD